MGAGKSWCPAESELAVLSCAHVQEHVGHGLPEANFARRVEQEWRARCPDAVAARRVDEGPSWQPREGTWIDRKGFAISQHFKKIKSESRKFEGYLQMVERLQLSSQVSEEDKAKLASAFMDGTLHLGCPTHKVYDFVANQKQNECCFRYYKAYRALRTTRAWSNMVSLTVQQAARVPDSPPHGEVLIGQAPDLPTPTDHGVTHTGANPTEQPVENTAPAGEPSQAARPARREVPLLPRVLPQLPLVATNSPSPLEHGRAAVARAVDTVEVETPVPAAPAPAMSAEEPVQGTPAEGADTQEALARSRLAELTFPKPKRPAEKKTAKLASEIAESHARGASSLARMSDIQSKRLKIYEEKVRIENELNRAKLIETQWAILDRMRDHATTEEQLQHLDQATRNVMNGSMDITASLADTPAPSALPDRTPPVSPRSDGQD